MIAVNFFLTPIQQFVGGWAYELMFLLILTSSFACGMAFHNTASRYMYSSRARRRSAKGHCRNA